MPHIVNTGRIVRESRVVPVEQAGLTVKVLGCVAAHVPPGSILHLNTLHAYLGGFFISLDDEPCQLEVAVGLRGGP